MLVRQSGKLRAAAFRTQGQTPEVQEDFTFHKATACPITLTNAPHKGYDYSGAPLLVDGLRGNNTNYRTGRWIGFVGKDLQATIDLGELKEVSQVNVTLVLKRVTGFSVHANLRCAVLKLKVAKCANWL